MKTWENGTCHAHTEFKVVVHSALVRGALGRKPFFHSGGVGWLLLSWARPACRVRRWLFSSPSLRGGWEAFRSAGWVVSRPVTPISSSPFKRVTKGRVILGREEENTHLIWVIIGSLPCTSWEVVMLN